MDCPHSTPDAWRECRNPNRPILAVGMAWKGGCFAGNPDGKTGLGGGVGVRGWVRRDDGYYEVFLDVCIYSRSSRLLWGSGNTRQIRVRKGCEVGARFLNPDCLDVRVAENRWIRFKAAAGSPKRSTDKPGDTQCCFGGWVEIRTLLCLGGRWSRSDFHGCAIWDGVCSESTG